MGLKFLFTVIGAILAGWIGLKFVRRNNQSRIAAYLITSAIVIATFVIIRLLDRFVFNS